MIHFSPLQFVQYCSYIKLLFLMTSVLQHQIVFFFLVGSVFMGHVLLCDRWFREDREQLSPIIVGERMSVLAAGLLHISKVRLEDMGLFLCWVNNSAGEETVQVTLTVTGVSFVFRYLLDKAV
jgi:hypothetical protein